MILRLIMSTTLPKILTSKWWLEGLEGVQKTSEGWVALCPAHDDAIRSLSLKELPNGEALVHCFAGCEYKDILDAVVSRTSGETPKLTIKSKASPTTPLISISGVDKVRAWWEQYTRIPNTEWESWGVVFTPTQVRFTWEDSSAIKVRTAGEKKFSWAGQVSAPPLWPTIPEKLDSILWLTEGESDCGVLRHLNFQAFSITKGAGKTLSTESWEALHSRGVKTVVLVFDSDSPGQEGAQRAFETIGSTPIDIIILDLKPLLNPLLGEKDLRDLFFRYGEPLQESIKTLYTRTLKEKRIRRKVILEDFLAQPIEEVSWLVEDIWLNQSTGLISGPPKSGKSWLALDLGLSVATGKPFLHKYAVERPGPVVLITSEDPDPLLQDRFKKILIAKGLGGSVDLPSITFPKNLGIPFHLDLDRDFTFSPQGTDSLLKWLRQIRDLHGRLALVIIDPILRFLPTGLDEYKASEVAASIFQTTSKIYKEFGAGVVLVHHKNKSGSDSKGSYGSIAFGAFAESALYLSPTGEDTRDWINVVGEYKSSAQTKWSYRFTELEEKYQVELSSEIKIEKVETGLSKEILRTLEDSKKGMSVGDLLQVLPNATEYTIRTSLKALEAHRKVEKLPPPPKSTPGPRADRWGILRTT